MTTKISWEFYVIGLHVYLLPGFELPLARVKVDKFLANVIFTLRRQNAVKNSVTFLHILSPVHILLVL